MTNREKFLEKLNNEGLAKMLYGYCYLVDVCDDCELDHMGLCVSWDIDNIVKWLESEVEEI